MQISGNYTPAASAALNVTIGGLTLGSQYSRLAVTGTATLNGVLPIALASGYAPNGGDSFQVVSCASRAGTFAGVNGTEIGNGSVFGVTYNATGVTLNVVQATPTPTAATTSTPSATPTSTASDTPTASGTPTVTDTPTPTATPTPGDPSPTDTPTETPVPSPTPTP